MAGRRYGRVMVSLRNHRKLDFLLGDVDLSLVVTRSRSSHGQHFLGVYLERRSMLSPNTTGIIGQFVYKTVGTVGRERPGTTNATDPNSSVRLAVVQPGPERTYQVSEVNAFLSSRRSLLHKTQVSCLYIKDQGRGLVAGAPSDYLRPCLAC
ncbi:inter-alpha-trypsin inhibitor heavy chain H2-like [Scylla paramamosain]|uniref:inter-alpha-trypsin inhibitor heavy chain H2-like n=1 Tax=Scylla paramamosain TaxID=85552 RepID=UPI0030828134